MQEGGVFGCLQETVINRNQSFKSSINRDLLKNYRCPALIASLLYAPWAWWGFATQTKIGHLQSILSKDTRWGMWGNQADEFTDMFSSADDELFRKVLNNPAHVLIPLLPRKKGLTYNLRPRAHQCILHIPSTAASKNFVQRMLFKHAYWLMYFVSRIMQRMLCWFSFLMLFLLL